MANYWIALSSALAAYEAMIIYNEWIPFKGFLAVTLYPFIFIRSEYKGKVNDVCLRHENIHIKQQKELLVIFFYIIYLCEWIFNLFRYQDSYKAYMNISFEKEAYAHEKDPEYKHRLFGQWRKN